MVYNGHSTYAYGQTPLHLQTVRHCIVQILGGESTGTYHCFAEFYGLTVMPTEFRKIMDTFSAKFKKVVVFSGDISIVSNGNKERLLAKMREGLKTLNEGNLLI